jgi:putative toxin-antitoxin system antitoxin component (TIGR02293 family)
MERLHPEIGDVLGLPGRHSDLDWAKLLSEGLPTSAFERLCAAIAPEDKSFPYELVPRSTLVRRRREARLTPEESERIQRMAEIWAFAVEVFGDDAKARRFLMREHALLRGERPIDLVIANAKGAQAVKGILGRLKYGSAA